MVSDPIQAENHDSLANSQADLRSVLAHKFPLSRWGTSGVVVGISGGPDSVALAHAAWRLGIGQTNSPPICLAHLNHALRGDESDGDQFFVESLAKEWKVELVTDRISGPVPNEGSLENTLRKKRYDFFVQVARQRGVRCVLLAHHQQDNAETILFRLFRGTSLRGLQGIPFSREIAEGISVVRPFLGVSRNSIMEYLDLHGIKSRTDSSNCDNGPARNWLRNELIPKLECYFGQDIPNQVTGLSRDVGEFIQLLDEIADSLLQKSRLSDSDSTVRLARSELQSAPPIIVRHLLTRIWSKKSWPQIDMTREKWRSLTELIHQTSLANKIAMPGRITATVTREEFSLVRK